MLAGRPGVRSPRRRPKRNQTATSWHHTIEQQFDPTSHHDAVSRLVRSDRGANSGRRMAYMDRPSTNGQKSARPHSTTWSQGSEEQGVDTGATTTSPQAAFEFPAAKSESRVPRARPRRRHGSARPAMKRLYREPDKRQNPEIEKARSVAPQYQSDARRASSSGLRRANTTRPRILIRRVKIPRA